MIQIDVSFFFSFFEIKKGILFQIGKYPSVGKKRSMLFKGKMKNMSSFKKKKVVIKILSFTERFNGLKLDNPIFLKKNYTPKHG